MTTTAVCPDGIERAVTPNADGIPTVVTPGGSVVTGDVTDGKFRPHARHHGAHKMWNPPPDEAIAPEDRSVPAEVLAWIDNGVTDTREWWEIRDWAEWDAEHEHGNELGAATPTGGDHPNIDVALGKAQQSAISMITDTSETWAKAEDEGAKVENGRLIVPPEAHDSAALALGMAFDRAHEQITSNGDGFGLDPSEKSEAQALLRLRDKLTKAGMTGHTY